MRILIDTHGLVLSEKTREIICRKFRFALTRFSPKVRQVTVKLTDINGPRKGTDKVCSVIAKLKNGKEIRTTGRAEKTAEAAATAAERARRVVVRMIDHENPRSWSRR